jgi:hypothetical protein
MALPIGGPSARLLRLPLSAKTRWRSGIVTEHDVLVRYRQRLFTLARELGNVSEPCRLMGVHRSTYYRLKR